MKQLRDDSEVLSNFLKEILTFQTCSCIYLNSPFTWAPNTHLLPSSSCGAKSFGFYLHLPKGLCIRRNKPTEVCGLSCEHSKNKTNTKNTEAKIYHGVLWIMTSLRSGINRERLAPLKGPVVNPGVLNIRAVISRLGYFSWFLHLLLCMWEMLWRWYL